MVDDPTRLSQEQREMVRKYLDRWKAPACPFCGSDQWFIGEHMVMPMTSALDGSPRVGGVLYPQVMLVSEGCGHTLYFNAVAVGLLPGRGGIVVK